MMHDLDTLKDWYMPIVDLPHAEKLPFPFLLVALCLMQAYQPQFPLLLI